MILKMVALANKEAVMGRHLDAFCESFREKRSFDIGFEPVIGYPNRSCSDLNLVIMIHGLGGCTHQYDGLNTYFKDQGFFTCLLPLPGHNSVSPYDLIVSSQDYFDFCDHVASHLKNMHHANISSLNFHFVGMSFGAAFVRKISDELTASGIKSNSVYISPFLHLSGAINQLKAEAVRFFDKSFYGIFEPLLNRLPIIRGRFNGKGVHGLPCIAIARAFDFAQQSHASKAQSMPRLIVQPVRDKVVSSDAAIARYQERVTFVTMHGHPHQMLDDERVDASHLTALNTLIFNGLTLFQSQEESGKYENESSYFIRPALLCGSFIAMVSAYRYFCSASKR